MQPMKLFVYRSFFICTIFFAALSGAQEPGEPASPFEKAKAAYGAAADAVLADYLNADYEFAQKYREDLGRIRDSAQQAGNLDVVLQVKNALAAFDADESVIDYQDEQIHGYVRKAAYDFSKSHEGVVAIKNGKLGALKEKYKAQLEYAMRVYTQQGNLDIAVEIKDEIARLNPPPVLAVDPVDSADASIDNGRGRKVSLHKNWPCSKEGLIFAWESPGWSLSRLLGRDSGLVDYKISHSGQNKEGNRMMNLGGGKSFVDESVNEVLINACRESNELSIEAIIQVDNNRQTGPARIISLSHNGLSRNFSLCQEAGEYRLRLRTTETGANGSNPEVALGPVDPDAEQHVVVSFRPGLITCYINGEQQETRQIGGDLSNWSVGGMRLLFGNESTEQRPWAGTLHHISIYSRSMDEREAKFRYQVATRNFGGERFMRPGKGVRERPTGPFQRGPDRDK
jgi:hypothetical protein